MRRGATEGGSGAEAECGEAPDAPTKRPPEPYVAPEEAAQNTGCQVRKRWRAN